MHIEKGGTVWRILDFKEINQKISRKLLNPKFFKTTLYSQDLLLKIFYPVHTIWKI